jgi:hypothetical protein
MCVRFSSVQTVADGGAGSLPAQGVVSPLAGEIWYASSVMAALMLFGKCLPLPASPPTSDVRAGLAVFFFFFGALP